MVFEPNTSASTSIGQVSSLGLYANRVTSSIVGRPLELAIAERELVPNRDGLVCLSLEGEPGIGKTRVLLAIEELARTHGFTSIAITADEEIRGPFLAARSIFASPAITQVAEGTPADLAVQRVRDALANTDDPGLDSLGADQKLVRIFDLAAVAIKALATERPLVILVDDLQWADEDSIRLLRYMVRTVAVAPIVLVLAARNDEVAFVTEAVALTADAERMGMLRRMRLGRFTQLESTDFLQQVLGGQINLTSAAAMHAQAEGVPFILSEQVVAYRDAGMIQQIDGTWTLARNAEKLLPSAVRTLIQRRSAHLPEETKTTLAEAAILGRAFSLRDLRDLKDRLSDETREALPLAEALAPAVAAGLLIQHPEESAADYTFYHDRVREYATEMLTPPRQRAIHGAIVQMLLAGGHPTPESLPLITQHSLAAGQGELCAEHAVEAARNALNAHAPEEVLRLVALAKPVASSPKIRVELLRLQDDALDMLRRPSARLEVLASLTALAEAAGDVPLETEVLLRRAAALRLSKDFDRAAEIAGRVRNATNDRGDSVQELAACKELGQALTRTELGEGYSPSMSEIDAEGAENAYQRVADLAEKLSDDISLAMALRELGVLGLGKVKNVIASMPPESSFFLMQSIAAGAKVEDLVANHPVIGPIVTSTNDRLKRALEIYDNLGDRQGAMSTIIAMAYITWVFDIHLSGSARRIEEIRRLATQMKSLTKESERAAAEAQMLYGAQVFSMAKCIPDSALEKGDEAYKAAMILGDRSLEFAAAGGMAITNADLGDNAEAERWLGRASEIAIDNPSALRGRRLSMWRGHVCCVVGDATGTREHLERAVQIATDQGRPAGRCEALALLAKETSALGAATGDEDLMAIAERAANDAKGLIPILPGHPLWGAQADAALARIHLKRGNRDDAAAAAREALEALATAEVEDLRLDIRLPAADALIESGSEEEAAGVREELRLLLSLTAPRIINDELRARWLASPVGSEFTRLAGPIASEHAGPEANGADDGMSNEDHALLTQLTQGGTNKQIAEALGTTEDVISTRLSALFVKMGASSRADATAAAIIGKMV